MHPPLLSVQSVKSSNELCEGYVPSSQMVVVGSGPILIWPCQIGGSLRLRVALANGLH